MAGTSSKQPEAKVINFAQECCRGKKMPANLETDVPESMSLTAVRKAMVSRKDIRVAGPVGECIT